MQKILSLFVMLSLACTAFGQKVDRGEYDELIAKSRRARTTATIMVSTGPVIAAGGIGTLIYGLVQRESGFNDYYYDANGNYVEVPAKKYTTEIVVGAAAAVVGLGVALTSIVFTNKARDYKDEARQVRLKTSTERINIPGMQNGYANSKQLKLSLVVPL